MRIDLRCILLLTAASLTNASAIRAQSPPSSFRLCLAYVSAIEEANKRFDQHWKIGETLVGERRDATRRLMETKGTVEYFLSQQQLGLLTIMQAQFAGMSIDAQMDTLLASHSQRYEPKNGKDAQDSFGGFKGIAR